MTLYDEDAGAYARHTATSTWNASYERPAMQRIIGTVNGRSVLDAGCASGELSAWLLSEGADVTALDNSTAFITMIQERFGQRLRACRADLAQGLPFADCAFDVVASSLTLHYIADWEALMRELFRITKPGGRLVFSTHHPSMTASLVTKYFKTALVRDVFTIDGKAYPVQFYHRSLEGIIAPVLAAGFAIRAICEPELKGTPQRPWFLFLDCMKTDGTETEARTLQEETPAVYGR